MNLSDDPFMIPILGRREVELRDVNSWQVLPLPKIGLPAAPWSTPNNIPHASSAEPAEQRPHYVAIRLLYLRPGLKYEDTCISEIRVAFSHA